MRVLCHALRWSSRLLGPLGRTELHHWAGVHHQTSLPSEQGVSSAGVDLRWRSRLRRRDGWKGARKANIPLKQNGNFRRVELCANIEAYFDFSYFTFVLAGLSCDSTELWRVSVVLRIQDPVHLHGLEVRWHGGLWWQEWWNRMSVVYCGAFSVCNIAW